MTTRAKAQPGARRQEWCGGVGNKLQHNNKRRNRRPAQAEQREQATAEQMTNFKNAFSVCLEAKEYMVKF